MAHLTNELPDCSCFLRLRAVKGNSAYGGKDKGSSKLAWGLLNGPYSEGLLLALRRVVDAPDEEWLPALLLFDPLLG
jgi:hypothetical protein